MLDLGFAVVLGLANIGLGPLPAAPGIDRPPTQVTSADDLHAPTGTSGKAPAAAADRSNACPDAAAPGERLWALSVRDGGSGPPAVAPDGALIYPGGRRAAHAVDCHGNLLWSRDIHVAATGAWSNGVVNGSAVGDDGTLYVVATLTGPFGPQPVLVALGSTGETRWSLAHNDPHPAPVFGALRGPAIDARGRVYVGVSTGARGVFSGIGSDGHLLPGFPLLSNGFLVPPVVLPGDRTAIISRPLVPANIALPTQLAPRPPSATPVAPPLATPSPTPVLMHVLHVPLLLMQSASDVTPGGTPLPPSRLDPAAPSPAMLHVVTGGQAPWNVFEIGTETAASLVASDKMIVFEAMGPPSRLIGLAVGTGAPNRIWEHATFDRIVGVPLIGRADDAAGRTELVYLDAAGRLVSLDVPAATGTAGGPTFNWAVQVPGTAGGIALGDDGLVYVVTGARVAAYRRADGGEAWARDALPNGERLFTGAPRFAVLAPGGTLYVATDGIMLMAFSTGAGGPDPHAAWPMIRHDARNSGRVGAVQ